MININEKYLAGWPPAKRAGNILNTTVKIDQPSPYNLVLYYI
jgi:hypothetical protein